MGELRGGSLFAGKKSEPVNIFCISFSYETHHQLFRFLFIFNFLSTNLVLDVSIEKNVEEMENNKTDEEGPISIEAFVLGVPFQITATHIRVKGKTQRDVIEHFLQPIYKSKNIYELNESLNTAKRQIEELGLFKAVSLEMEADQKQWLYRKETGQEVGPAFGVLNVYLIEKGHLNLDIGTSAESGGLSTGSLVRLYSFKLFHLNLFLIVESEWRLIEYFGKEGSCIISSFKRNKRVFIAGNR
jgi:hypothetical protein